MGNVGTPVMLHFQNFHPFTKWCELQAGVLIFAWHFHRRLRWRGHRVVSSSCRGVCNAPRPQCCWLALRYDTCCDSLQAASSNPAVKWRRFEVFQAIADGMSVVFSSLSGWKVVGVERSHHRTVRQWWRDVCRACEGWGWQLGQLRQHDRRRSQGYVGWLTVWIPDRSFRLSLRFDPTHGHRMSWRVGIQTSRPLYHDFHDN